MARYLQKRFESWRRISSPLLFSFNSDAVTSTELTNRSTAVSRAQERAGDSLTLPSEEWQYANELHFEKRRPSKKTWRGGRVRVCLSPPLKLDRESENIASAMNNTWKRSSITATCLLSFSINLAPSAEPIALYFILFVIFVVFYIFKEWLCILWKWSKNYRNDMHHQSITDLLFLLFLD